MAGDFEKKGADDYIILDAPESRRIAAYFLYSFLTKYIAYIVPPALLLVLLTYLSDLQYPLKTAIEVFLVLFLVSSLIVLSASILGVLNVAFQGLFRHTTPPHTVGYLELPAPFENIRHYRLPTESRGLLAGYLGLFHLSLGVTTLVLWWVLYELSETPWTIARKIIHIVPSVISESVIHTATRVTNLPIDIIAKQLNSPTFIIGAVLFFGPLLFFLVLAMWNFMYAIEVGLQDRLNDLESG